eukprot:CAMPEP_0206303074 /NCGR_PEP_ID=MMETSP0106_2-20121207/9050_1 /ASSEMBLY_ACC=CAM_ASM_000206 /TAXON_ID=81532 /ORGANISM="Acanthoeca-like sp., Strain 10tr" /LENGTH=196 /DNA_ID=CAMNT_0053733859 /DNA_START=166 /DNA_END=751 /DNA_ORIENTATION=-
MPQRAKLAQFQRHALTSRAVQTAGSVKPVPVHVDSSISASNASTTQPPRTVEPPNIDAGSSGVSTNVQDAVITIMVCLLLFLIICTVALYVHRRTKTSGKKVEDMTPTETGFTPGTDLGLEWEHDRLMWRGREPDRRSLTGNELNSYMADKHINLRHFETVENPLTREADLENDDAMTWDTSIAGDVLVGGRATLR